MRVRQKFWHWNTRNKHKSVVLNVCPSPVASTSSRNSLEMQILGPQPRPMAWVTLAWGKVMWLLTTPGDSDACSGLGTSGRETWFANKWKSLSQDTLRLKTQDSFIWHTLPIILITPTATGQIQNPVNASIFGIFYRACKFQLWVIQYKLEYIKI